ncbi:MAG: hypothetical protein ACTSPY_05475 [Candidatus Helarchaeota archaeon]
MQCPKCNNDGIPIKINIRKDNVRIKNSCVNCKKSFLVSLKFKDRKSWIPIIKENLFKCTKCGVINEDWVYDDRFVEQSSSFTNGINLQNLFMEVIIFKCQCGYKNKRIIRREIWHHLQIE